MTHAVGTLRNVRIDPDIENEGTLTFRIKLQHLHFQSSARNAKKSNDFLALISFLLYKVEEFRSKRMQNMEIQHVYVLQTLFEHPHQFLTHLIDKPSFTLAVFFVRSSVLLLVR
jgi:hypothetical protein